MVEPLDFRSRGSFTFASNFEARWKTVRQALEPVLGVRGVAALFERALFLTSRQHPWLAATPGDAKDLLSLMAVQDPVIAAQAADTLSTVFQNQLIAMIGQRLAQQLLGPAWIGPELP